MLFNFLKSIVYKKIQSTTKNAFDIELSARDLTEIRNNMGLLRSGNSCTFQVQLVPVILDSLISGNAKI